MLCDVAQVREYELYSRMVAAISDLEALMACYIIIHKRIASTASLGNRLIRYAAVAIASAQKDLGIFA